MAASYPPLISLFENPILLYERRWSLVTTNKLGWRGKTLIIVFLLFMSGLISLGVRNEANAAPTVTIRSGDMVNDASLFGFLPSGACTLVAGKDAVTGNNVALTMGHCSGNGNQVNTNWLTPIGRMQHATFSVTGARQVNQIDIGVIKLNPNVRVVRSGHSVSAPQPGQRLVKRGYGLWTPRVDEGIVSSVYETDFRLRLQASPFDSGGLLTDQTGAIIGLVSRGFKDYTSPDTVAMRFDKVLQFISAEYGIKLVSY